MAHQSHSSVHLLEWTEADGNFINESKFSNDRVVMQTHYGVAHLANKVKPLIVRLFSSLHSSISLLESARIKIK